MRQFAASLGRTARVEAWLPQLSDSNLRSWKRVRASPTGGSTCSSRSYWRSRVSFDDDYQVSPNENNDGKSFERLTQQVFNLIVNQGNQGDAKTVDVQHDVKIKGRDGAEYQIDVCWEFEAGGIKYRTLLSCKDWQTAVKREHVMAFKAVLDEVPGQPRGVVVSRVGFQEGAVRFAEQHGIELYELREPDIRNMGDRIMSVVATIRIASPHFGKADFVIDETWVKEEAQRLGIPKGTTVNFSKPGSEALLAEDGTPVTTVSKFVQERLMPHTADVVVPPTVLRHTFDQPLYVLLPSDSPWSRVRVIGLQVEFRQTIYEQQIRADVHDLIAFVLQRVSDGRVAFLRHDGTVTTPDD